MPVLGKWLEGTRPDRPVRDVAERAVRERLAAVRYFARRARKRYGEDEEYVHQLRVFSRHARASLQVFSEWLPRARMRWMKRTLRGLRQSAGDARDLDVLANRLSDLAGSGRFRRLRKVLKQVRGERCAMPVGRYLEAGSSTRIQTALPRACRFGRSRGWIGRRDAP